MIEVLISLNTQDLTVAQQRILKEELEQSVHKYRRHQDLSSLPVDSSVARLTEYIEKAYEVAVMMVKTGSLIITVQCPTLESLESLWNGYCSGYLNDIVERFLVTDELKRKLGMDNVRLKTTIEEENYLICKKYFFENSGEWSSLSRAFLGNTYFGVISFMERFLFLYQISVMYRSDRRFNISPPRATPRAFDFFENYCSNSPLPGPKCRSNAPH